MEGLRLPKWGVGGILLRSERTPQSCVSAPLVIFMLNGNPVCLASVREYLLFFNDTTLFVAAEGHFALCVGPVVVSEQDLKAVDVADAAQQAYFLIGGVGKVVEQVFADVPDIIPSILTKAGYITLSLDEQPYWV